MYMMANVFLIMRECITGHPHTKISSYLFLINVYIKVTELCVLDVDTYQKDLKPCTQLNSLTNCICKFVMTKSILSFYVLNISSHFKRF